MDPYTVLIWADGMYILYKDYLEEDYHWVSDDYEEITIPLTIGFESPEFFNYLKRKSYNYRSIIPMQNETREQKTLRMLKNNKKPLSRKALSKLVCNSTEKHSLNLMSAFITTLRKKGVAIRKTRKRTRVYYKYLGETTHKPREKAKLTSVQVSSNLIDRCMHLIKAKAPQAITVDAIADFFDISTEKSSALLNKVSVTHPDKVQLTIQAAA